MYLTTDSVIYLIGSTFFLRGIDNNDASTVNGVLDEMKSSSGLSLNSRSVHSIAPIDLYQTIQPCSALVFPLKNMPSIHWSSYLLTVSPLQAHRFMFCSVQNCSFLPVGRGKVSRETSFLFCSYYQHCSSITEGSFQPPASFDTPCKSLKAFPQRYQLEHVVAPSQAECCLVMFTHSLGYLPGPINHLSGI